MMGVIAIVTALVDLIPKAVAAGISVAGLWAQVDQIIAEHRKPDDAEWQALDAYVKARKDEFAAAAAEPQE